MLGDLIPDEFGVVWKEVDRTTDQVGSETISYEPMIPSMFVIRFFDIENKN